MTRYVRRMNRDYRMNRVRYHLRMAFAWLLFTLFWVLLGIIIFYGVDTLMRISGSEGLQALSTDGNRN